MLTINITTTRQRLHLCRISVLSLLMQSFEFDCVNIWISRKPYLLDTGIDDDQVLEEFMSYFSKEHRGKVKFNWVENTGPYRKLLPALRAANFEDVIVTADDDIFYDQNWLKSLMRNFSSDGIVKAGRVRKIKRNFAGYPISYIHWPLYGNEIVLDDEYIVTFGGGVVLTRNMFLEEDIFDDSYLDVAPTSDDLWYSKLLKRTNRRVHVLPDSLNQLNFIDHDSGLIGHNLPSGSRLMLKLKTHLIDRNLGLLGMKVCENDRAFQKIESYFARKN